MIEAASYMYFPLLILPSTHGYQQFYRPMRTRQFAIVDWNPDSIVLPLLGKFRLRSLYTTKQHPKPTRHCTRSKSWLIILEFDNDVNEYQFYTKYHQKDNHYYTFELYTYL